MQLSNSMTDFREEALIASEEAEHVQARHEEALDKLYDCEIGVEELQTAFEDLQQRDVESEEQWSSDLQRAVKAEELMSEEAHALRERVGSTERDCHLRETVTKQILLIGNLSDLREEARSVSEEVTQLMMDRDTSRLVVHSFI